MSIKIMKILFLFLVAATFVGCQNSTPVTSNDCVTHEDLKVQMQVTIVIVANGTPMMLPPNIGIEPECTKALHTHDGSSIVYVESPNSKEFTLLDFMEVWGDQNPYRELPEIKISLNGELFSGDFEDLILKDGDRIVVDYRDAR